MSGQPVLEVRDLARSFGGFRAVADVSFAVGAGEVVALIGPNGAGKTTVFNLINGQLKPDRGEVLLAGEVVTGSGPRRLWRKGVARTFQITATFSSMTVAENVAVALLPVTASVWSPLRLTSHNGPEVARLIADVGLEGKAEALAGTLAYGDRKRVELAISLASAPRLLLMDEPTAGMAAAEREALMAAAVEACRQRGASILFTEHDMGVVFRHANRVLVLSAGRLIADGTPEEIRESQVVREVYLGRAGGKAAAG
jgi:branched-chain amino acid transport system ATP-binding protein